MTLATRCTSCGTVFRVVQDQLKVSEGWVRCGRCNEVFSALEGLFDLGRENPPEWSPEAPAAVTTEHEIHPAERTETRPSAGPTAREARTTPAARVNERDRLDFPDARFDSELLGDYGRSSEAGALPGLALEGAPALVGDAAAPEFLRHAQRRERWHDPNVRALLGGAAAVLALALVLQWVHHFRDGVAARLPLARPVLGAWCALASCSIDAPRRIEDVSVESTALTRAPGPDAFKLAVALRNRGALIVALPSVDLSLTDPGGQLVARRVLTPLDFRVASTTLAPGAEAALQVVLSAGLGAGVTGYTVEIFYP